MHACTETALWFIFSRYLRKRFALFLLFLQNFADQEAELFYSHGKLLFDNKNNIMLQVLLKEYMWLAQVYVFCSFLWTQGVLGGFYKAMHFIDNSFKYSIFLIKAATFVKKPHSISWSWTFLYEDDTRSYHLTVSSCILWKAWMILVQCLVKCSKSQIHYLD